MNDLFDLTGSVALITGGNGGIGLGMARGLAAAGAAVAIWGTNASKNDGAAEELRTMGAEVETFQCDVGDPTQVAEQFEATLERFGHVDTCVANAGVGGNADSFVDMSLEEWRRVQRVNSEGAIFTLQAAARHMIERSEGGSLIGVSSMSAICGQPRGEHYAHSKAGLVAVMKSLAVELARYGIRANAVLPGWTATDMTAGAVESEKFTERVISRVPLRRWADVDEFAGIAVYLAAKASSYHTGDELLIDGGYMCF